MNLGMLREQLVRRLLGRYRSIKSFERELQAGGGMAGCVDAGVRAVEVRKVVGTVGRAGTLRGDFFHRRGQAMTARHHRVGQALEQGMPLPPLELYKLSRAPRADAGARVTEYYVMDGHHRVAMARKLGHDFLDAHVVVYQLADPAERSAGCLAPDTGIAEACS